ncbi:MAG: energy transducer TonB [Deltaproteobacteria bacterium]|nr:energy transducer TonB [Deltaproteobacteria bacterium]
MKRFLAALGFSLALHALLFYSNPNIASPLNPEIRLPRHLTVDLSYRLPPAPPEPEPVPPAPALRRPEPPPPVPKPDPPKKAKPLPVQPKPQRPKPARKTLPPEPEPEPQRTAPEPMTPVSETPSPFEERASDPPLAVSKESRAIEPVAPPPPVPTPVKEARPAYKKNPPPSYPRSARRRGMEGKVLLEVFVSAQGKPEKIKLLESSGHGVLDRAALSAVRSWIFEPGTIGDRPVGMWVRVPIRFELK